MENHPPVIDARVPLMSAAEIEQLGEEIAELSAHLEAATARLLELIREFDARQGWATGFRSCAEWLGWKVGLNPGAAREKVRVARALGRLPQIAAALGRGELSYAKVRALTRVATPETEPRLLAVARAGTAPQVERIVRGWRRVDRQAEAEEADRRHRNRALTVSHDDDGMVVIRGRLEPEAGALLLRALEAAREAAYQKALGAAAPMSAEPAPTAPTPAGPTGEAPTLAQQQADALVLLAETALHHELDPGPADERYQVAVHVDAPVLANPEAPGQSVLNEGVHVSAETSERLACDASRVVMRHDADGRVLDVGRRTRTIAPALRRALLHRDRGCRFPGCGLLFCQGHHLRHWANGGPTTLDNLALLCRRHHRAVHEEGFRVERRPDGELHFRRPDGRPLPAVPPSVAVPADPVGALRMRHRAQGLAVRAQSLTPSWPGERLDLGWALDVLHPLANPVVPR
jgi:5-methylcytosine-specific restriction endonuclease McrA